MRNQFIDCIATHPGILMEGALGERLKREYGIAFDPHIDMGGLVYTQAGREALEALWAEYAGIARRYDLPFLATTPTRRTNRERLAETAYPATILRDNVAFLRRVQQKQSGQMYIGGLMGCRGEAYTGAHCLPREEAAAFHAWEAEGFAQAGVDFLYAALIPTLEEAAGIAQAIKPTSVPYLLSFTMGSDGCLADGTLLCNAIRELDSIHPPVCYMTNCVHPKIVEKALKNPGNDDDLVRCRFLGLQANTSCLPYGVLDGSAQLHTTDPVALAEDMLTLREIVPMKIFGGCCGTDGSHMEQIAKRIG